MTLFRSIRVFMAAGLALLAASWLVGCASVAVRTLTFSEADMARLLEQRGPYQRRLLEVLDVRITNPRVKLLPVGDRLSTDMNVAMTERVSNRTYQGRIAFEYGLRYDDVLNAIRVTQVRVDKLQIDGLPAPQQAGIKRLGTLIAEQLLDDTVLYQFTPADLKSVEGKGVKPSAVAVTPRGVEVTLSPVNR